MATVPPELRGKLVLVQIAVPSRSDVEDYAQLSQKLEDQVTTLNNKWRSGSWEPICLLKEHCQPERMMALHRLANFFVVTSLHDGMNLVAKEFVAARDDDQGVLILSSFAGASREMSEALIVNPYDGQDMAAALVQALSMPVEEQRERMRLMRQQVREQNVYRWAGRMLVDAARVRQKDRVLELSNRTKAAPRSLAVVALSLRRLQHHAPRHSPSHATPSASFSRPGRAWHAHGFCRGPRLGRLAHGVTRACDCTAERSPSSPKRSSGPS